MPEDLGNGDYDSALRDFVAEREQIARSQEQVWHNNILATIVAFVVFLAGTNIGKGQITNTINELFPLVIDEKIMGFALFIWFISAFVIAFIAYSYSRILYYSKLADSIGSEFKPDRDDLIEWSYLRGGASRNHLTDLRRQFYSSYEHILTIQFLEEEYKDIHEQGKEDEKRGLRHHWVWEAIRSIIGFFAGGDWISLDPRRSEEPPFKYHYRALFWPHALCRSFSLGFSWASIGGLWVAWRTGSPELTNIFVVFASISIVSCFFQYVRFSGRIEELCENAHKEKSQQTFYTCPVCQAELSVGQNCGECGQQIDWDNINLPLNDTE